MQTAISAALNEGAEAVIVIGTDCPERSHDVLARARRCLETHGLVLGPADDGGNTHGTPELAHTVGFASLQLPCGRPRAGG